MKNQDRQDIRSQLMSHVEQLDHTYIQGLVSQYQETTASGRDSCHCHHTGEGEVNFFEKANSGEEYVLADRWSRTMKEELKRTSMETSTLGKKKVFYRD